MKKENFDVVVAGGGSAGIAAAIGASRTGARVLLVERSQAFGGQAVNSWISAYCGFYSKGSAPQQVVYGIGDEVLQRLKAHGENIAPTINPSTHNASIRFRPVVLARVLDELMLDSRVDYRLATSLIAATRGQDGRLQSVLIQDDEETVEVSAKAFVDATGNANLVHLAGLPTNWGGEQGEVQQASLSCLIDGLPAREFSVDELSKAIRAGRENGIEGLDVDRGMIVKVPEDSYGFLTMPSIEPENFGGKNLTKNMMTLRTKAWHYVQALSTYHPDLGHAKLLATSPILGYREGRRLQGIKTITGEDAAACRKDPHTIGRAGWPFELHSANGMSFKQIKENDWYDIPAEALMSRDCANLYGAGRLVSTDHLAMASIRVMGTGFASGHGAGILAAQYAADGQTDIEKVQKILKEQNALL